MIESQVFISKWPPNPNCFQKADPAGHRLRIQLPNSAPGLGPGHSCSFRNLLSPRKTSWTNPLLPAGSRASNTATAAKPFPLMPQGGQEQHTRDRFEPCREENITLLPERRESFAFRGANAICSHRPQIRPRCAAASLLGARGSRDSSSSKECSTFLLLGQQHAARTKPGLENASTPELARCRAGSAQKVPPEVAPNLPGDAASERGNLGNSGGRTGNTLDCKAEGRQPGLAHCFWPWSTRKSLSHPQEEASSSKRAGKLLWDGNHL